MTKGILVALMATTLSFGTAFSCDSTGHGGFAPENNMKIEVGDKASNTMTQETFCSLCSNCKRERRQSCNE
jgi:hypothetical protein